MKGKLLVIVVITALPFTAFPDIWTLTPFGDRIYGGTSSPYRCLFYYDTGTGEVTLVGKMEMEIYSLTTGRDGLIYGGSSTALDGKGAHFFVYDPRKPWNPGRSPDNNPYDMGSLVPDEPWGRDALIADLIVGEDGKIYGGIATAFSLPGRGKFLFSYDPKERKIRKVVEPVPGENIRGTSGGKLFSYDPSTGRAEVVADVGMHIGAGSLVVDGDGMIYGGARNRLFAYDPVKEKCKFLRRMDADIRGLAIKDGKIYGGLSNGHLFVFDPKAPPGEDNPSDLGALPVARVRTVVAGNDGRIYAGCSGLHLFVVERGRIKEIPMLALLPPGRITPGAVIPQMEMQFKGKTGVLYGCVVDMGINPMPVSGAKVIYRAGSKSGEVVTDETGNFRIELPAGHCSLYVYREGYLPREGVMAVILPGGESFCKIRMRKKVSPAIEEQQKVLGIGIEVTDKFIQHKLLVEIHDPKPPPFSES